MTTKKENPVEGEVVEEIKINMGTGECCVGHGRRGSGGLFFGVVLLVWGLAILSDTYLGTQLTSNIWPMLAVVFGAYLIFTSFKR